MRCNVKLHQRFWTAQGVTLGFRKREAELAVDRGGRWHCQRFGQVPKQLTKLSHIREHFEHLTRDLRLRPPIRSTESDLRGLLPGTEAVEDGAAREAPFPEVVVDAAAEVGLQIRTGLPGS